MQLKFFYLRRDESFSSIIIFKNTSFWRVSKVNYLLALGMLPINFVLFFSPFGVNLMATFNNHMEFLWQ